jgi:hypothetical protein
MDDKQGVEGIRATGIVSSPDTVIYERPLTRGQFTSPCRLTLPWVKLRGWVANDESGVRVLLLERRAGQADQLHEVKHRGRKIEGPGLALEAVGDDVQYTVTEHEDVTTTPRINAVYDGVFTGLAAPPDAPEFADVRPSEGELYEAAMWARRRGIVGGYEDGSFRPGAAVTRGQLVRMLYRLHGK